MTTKTELIDQHAKMQKEMDAMQAKIDGMDGGDKVEVWPGEGDEVWYIQFDGKPACDSNWGNDEYDKAQKKSGNCFRTEKGAELKVRQNEYLTSMKEGAKEIDYAVGGDNHFYTIEVTTIYTYPDRMSFDKAYGINAECMLKVAK